MLNFTLRQIEYFRAAAIRGSISAAAEQERVSRSALASAVSDLERALGRQLFTRHKAKGVALTPHGVQLFEISGEVIESAGRITTALRGGELSGRLAIGCFVSLGPTVVPALFDYFRTNHPGVRLEPHAAAAGKLISLLRSGEIELAVGYQLHDTEGIQSEELYADRIHVILPEGHRLAQHPTVHAADLMDETLVLLDATPSPDNVHNYFASHGFVSKPKYRFQDYEIVRSLVARGVGYSIVIQRPASDVSYEGFGLVARELSPRPVPTPVSCSWLAGRSLTPSAVVAREALRGIARPVGIPPLYADSVLTL